MQNIMAGNSKKLRPYQEKAIEDIRAAFQDGHKSVLLQLATGGGKTLTVVNMISRALNKGNGAWFLCHRRELVDQASRTMKDNGLHHGIIAAGSYPNLMQKIQICSIQTLVKRVKRLKNPPLVVFDEAHHIAAKCWEDVFTVLSEKGSRFIGLSATPERLDGKGLDKFFSHMVNGPTPEQLLDMGYLSPFKVFAPSPVNRSAMKTRMGDFAKEDAEREMDKPSITGDAITHYLKHANGKKAIVFCCSIKHSEHVVASFNAAGIPALHVDGSSEPQYRADAIKKFASGEVKILSNVELFGEGFDIPDAEVAILLRPTQSLALHLQQVGRVLRPIYCHDMPLDTDEQRKAAINAGTKPYAVILDHAGNCLQHGLPDEERQWSLKGREQKKSKRPKEQAETVKQCPVCYHVQKAFFKTCQSCGHVFEVKKREINMIEGDLKEITREQKLELEKQRRKQQFDEQRSARSLDELIKLGKARGYKQPHAWAKHIIKARGGQ